MIFKLEIELVVPITINNINHENNYHVLQVG